MASTQGVDGLSTVKYAGNGVYYTDTFEKLALQGTVSAGTGITVTGGDTINNAGVLSVTGTANQVTASATTGAIVLSLPAQVNLPGNLNVAASVVVGSALSVAGNIFSTSGQIQASGGGNVSTSGGGFLLENGNRVLTGLTAGTGISVTGSAPNLTVTATSGGVTSVSGTSNQITVTPTSGATVVSLPAAITFPGSIATANAVTYNSGASISSDALVGTTYTSCSGSVASPTTVSVPASGSVTATPVATRHGVFLFQASANWTSGASVTVNCRNTACTSNSMCKAGVSSTNVAPFNMSVMGGVNNNTGGLGFSLYLSYLGIATINTGDTWFVWWEIEDRT